MTEPTETYWDIEITPKNNLFDLKLIDTWHYRDLLFLLVKRDFVSFYKQTILGPIWFFVQPVITIVMYTVVFGNLAGIPTDGIPHPVFYLAGTIIWSYFSECLSKTSTVFRDNAGMLGKVYFPRLIMPLSIVLSSLVKFGVQLLLFILLFAWFYIKGAAITPNAYALLFPVLILLIAAQGLGWGMIISAVTTKYRDLAFVVGFIVPLLMYATTVIYPLSEVQLKFPHYYWVVQYNPVTVAIETFRYGFFGKGTFSWALFGYFFVNTIIILFAGTVIFNRVEKTFVDTV
jgi:lipopolysaccharide transport system permease protein